MEWRFYSCRLGATNTLQGVKGGDFCVESVDFPDFARTTIPRFDSTWPLTQNTKKKTTWAEENILQVELYIEININLNQHSKAHVLFVSR